MATRIQLRRGTAAAWTAADPTLAEGEIGYETDTARWKVGTGSTAWSSLAYMAGGSGSGVSSFNTRTGAVTPASGDYTVGQVTGAAPLASPTFTGTPAGPTPAAGTNTTQLATTAYVRTELAALVASAPAALDTLNELAAALGNDASFSTTITTAMAGKAATVHTHALSALTQSGAATNQVPQWNGSAWVPATIAGGGTAGDLLSALTAAEVSVAGATTLTASAFGRWHDCTGTTADYAVTLPSPSGNAGKLIGVRMDPALTRFVTLDAGSGLTIDGQQTRVMWAQESVILLCDGATWAKVAGRTRPFTGRANRVTTTQAVANNTVTKVLLNAVGSDPSGRVVDTTNGRLNFPRAGLYQAVGSVCLTGFAANAPSVQSRIHLNGATAVATAVAVCSALTGGAPTPVCTVLVTAASGDYCELYAQQTSGGSVNTYVTEPLCNLTVTEVPQW